MDSFRKAWHAQSSTNTIGFLYATTWTDVQQSSEGGCHWCELLLSKRNDSYRPMLEDSLEVNVYFNIVSKDEDVAPKGVQKLCLALNGHLRAVFYVSAAPGMCRSYSTMDFPDERVRSTLR